MCHSKLRVKLGPLINFIIGHNGSGKSAVLTALTLCLGAKATVTNRGGNLKAFIKEGEESCTLSVKIKNQGDLAYQPEIYGRSIIVERHFTRSGTSGFKIKNAEERNISTKRSDLEDIIDFFGLQLDNPMNVLSQDMARQFLSNSTPHDKYKFFIRGTQLEQLDRDYQLMEETLDNTEAKLESREQDIAVLEQRARAAGEKKKLIDRSRTIQDTIKQLQWQHAWAQVEEQEKNLADIDDKIRAEEEHIERLTREAQKKSEEYDECNQTSEAAAQVIEDLRNQLEPIAQEHAANKDRFDENKERITSVHAQQRNIRQDLTGAKKRIARLKQEIQAEHARLEGANGPAHHQKLVELEELRSRVEELRSEQQEHAGRLEQLKAEARSSEENHKASLGPLQEKREARGQEENSLKGLQSEQGQGWRAYHRNTQLLLRAIANEGRFSIKPVGPVGRHIRLLKPEWGSVIERTMGGVAEAYIVTNKTDHGILSELMRRCDCQASIFIGNPQRIDTSRNEPDPAVDTMLRVMEFDSDLVRNQLIINQAIEQTVLIKDRDEAANFMFEKGRPRNVKVTICMHERGGGVRFTFTRSGGQSSGPVAAWKAAPRIPTDVEAQIRIQKDRVNEAERDFQEAERRSRALEVVAKCCQSAIKRHVNEQKEHRINLQRIEDEIARLEGEIEADTADDVALNELKLQLETAKEEEETAASSYQDAVNAKDEYNELATELKRRMDTSQAEVDEIKHKIQKTELRSQQRAQQRETALREKNEAIDLLEAAKHDKTELEQQRQAQAEIIQETFIRGAEAIHARVTVEPGMTAAKLDARIDKLAEEQRRFEQEAGGSREEITRAWAQAVQEYKAATRQFKELKRFCTMLKKTLLHRQHRWAAFRKLITSKAKIMFTYMLGERGFRGHILVDHKTKGLDINVSDTKPRALEIVPHTNPNHRSSLIFPNPATRVVKRRRCQAARSPSPPSVSS